MGRYLAGHNRVSAGIATIAVVAVTGMAATAVVLVHTSTGTQILDARPAPTMDPNMPTPVPMPTGGPRSDVLTYTVMSNQWAAYGQAQKETLCVAWDGGYVFRNGKAVTLTKSQVVVQEMRRAAKQDAHVLDYLEHGTVAQFLGEACQEFDASSPGEIGSAASIDKRGSKR